MANATNKKHFVIIVPGLGDGVKNLQFATSYWHWFGLTPRVHSVGWRDGEDFQPKLNRLITLIDSYAQNGNTVSLVGTSAGGSAVLNAFSKRRHTVHRVINVCGRLQVGTHEGFRSFEFCTQSSPAFAQSVQLREKIQTFLTPRDKQKIMTVRSLFFDDAVPSDTTIIKGAINTTVPIIGHIPSIACSLTFLSQPLLIFLKEGI